MTERLLSLWPASQQNTMDGWKMEVERDGDEARRKGTEREEMNEAEGEVEM